MISVDFSAAVVVAIVFLLVLALDRTFFEPLARALETRRERLEMAERLRVETAGAVDEVLTTCREATGRARSEGYEELERARAEAQAARSRRVDSEREKGLAEIAGARAALRRQSEEAVKGLQAESDRLAAEIASRLLGRKVA